ncbi:MAG: BamA/TamA family outer membrane protein [Nitrospira sp.]|nr:BamA/TamA family outer membrane protein [Nitrospira sp.]
MTCALLFASTWDFAIAASSTPNPLPQAASQAEADEGTFTIRDFFVQGNNLLMPDRVDAILAPFIGPARRFSDIEKARAALEQAYRGLGYPAIVVTVPEQTVEYGVITLTVYEGRLKSIDVTDAWFFSQGYVRGKLPAIRPGALLHEPTVLKQLDALNVNPDLKVVPILKPSDDPGQLDLELKVKDRPPVHGKVELNNRGVPTTPRLRLNAALQYTNVFNADHVITLQTSQTPQDWGAVEVYSGNYVIPLGSPDHQLMFYGATASSRASLNSSPLPVGGGFDIFGNAVIGGARYLVPFAAGGTMKHQLSVGLDYKHLDRSEGVIPGGVATVTVSNPLTYTPLSIGYTGIRPDELGFTRVTAITRGYVAGLVPGGDTEDFGGDPNDPLNKPGLRRFSTGTFVVVQGGLDRNHRLPYDFTLLAKAGGQWTNEPVVPTEQYFAGGLETVRGYREFEAVGDHAALASLEVVSPPLSQLPGEHIRRSMRLAAFYDLAYLWLMKPLPGQTDRAQLEGAGIGLRFTLSDHLRFRYDAAWTLRPGPFTPTGAFYGHFVLEAVF